MVISVTREEREALYSLLKGLFDAAGPGEWPACLAEPDDVEAARAALARVRRKIEDRVRRDRADDIESMPAELGGEEG